MKKLLLTLMLLLSLGFAASAEVIKVTPSATSGSQGVISFTTAKTVVMHLHLAADSEFIGRIRSR